MSAQDECGTAQCAGAVLDLQALLASQRAAFAADPWPDAARRRDRLTRLLAVLDDEAAWVDALDRMMGVLASEHAGAMRRLTAIAGSAQQHGSGEDGKHHHRHTVMHFRGQAPCRIVDNSLRWGRQSGTYQGVFLMKQRGWLETASLVTGACLLFAATAIAQAPNAAPPPPPSVKVGQAAPDFTASYLAMENGRPGFKQVKLSDYKGQKNVVLAFFPAAFSAGCSGAVERLPDLAARPPSSRSICPSWSRS